MWTKSEEGSLYLFGYLKEAERRRREWGFTEGQECTVLLRVSLTRDVTSRPRVPSGPMPRVMEGERSESLGRGSPVFPWRRGPGSYLDVDGVHPSCRILQVSSGILRVSVLVFPRHWRVFTKGREWLYWHLLDKLNAIIKCILKVRYDCTFRSDLKGEYRMSHSPLLGENPVR